MKPAIEIEAAYVMDTVWSSLVNFCLAGGFSKYKTAQRIWLRILSIALEDALKILDLA